MLPKANAAARNTTMATTRIAVQRPKRRFRAGATARAGAVARICVPPLNCASPRPRRFVDILAFPWIPHCGARAPQSVLSLKPHYNKRRPRAGAPQVLAYANFIGKRAPGRRSASVAARQTGSGQRGVPTASPPHRRDATGNRRPTRLPCARARLRLAARTSMPSMPCQTARQRDAATSS